MEPKEFEMTCPIFLEPLWSRPVFVTDYPKEVKSFYMKLNADGKTVRGMYTSAHVTHVVNWLRFFVWGWVFCL